MNFAVKSNGTDNILEIEGRIDTATAPELDQKVMEIIDDIDKLCLDLSKVEYISSAGLRVLLKTQKIINEKSGTMRLTGVNNDVMEIFEMTGFSDILLIETSF